MPRSFRQSRFRGRQEMGEDINPSAYIVNLADCMLVLACGFMVAMITYWNIDVSNVTELQSDDLEAVNPDTLPESMQSGGSYYIEAGTVYLDPSTGQLYMVQGADAASGGDASGEAAGADTGTAAPAGGDEGSAASLPSISDARAAGAD